MIGKQDIDKRFRKAKRIIYILTVVVWILIICAVCLLSVNNEQIFDDIFGAYLILPLSILFLGCILLMEAITFFVVKCYFAAVDEFTNKEIGKAAILGVATLAVLAGIFWILIMI